MYLTQNVFYFCPKSVRRNTTGITGMVLEAFNIDYLALRYIRVSTKKPSVSKKYKHTSLSPKLLVLMKKQQHCEKVSFKKI